MKTTSVLLVEDNLPDARYVREILSPGLYTVVHSASLGEAHELLGGGNFDVILLDLSLPDASGIDTFRALMEWASAVPIVVLTGLDDQDVAILAVNLGAQDFILKREIAEYTLSRAIRYAIERKQFQQNAQRFAMLEQREEFMATLTHDLKNPLIGANRILELMAEHEIGVVSDQQAKLLLQLRDNNKMLLSMIQNLIEVYRFEQDMYAVSLVNTNLLSIISACLEDIAFIAKNRQIHIQAELPNVVRDVMADANAIRRVLQNLLDNALKFTPRGGKIRLNVHPTNGTVAVEIEDTGPGIPLEEQNRLFQRFSQGRAGKKYTPGTGLGLYLCKQIVDAHHGQIAFTSKGGTGSIFTVTLPAA